MLSIHGAEKTTCPRVQKKKKKKNRSWSPVTQPTQKSIYNGYGSNLNVQYLTLKLRKIGTENPSICG